jgi:uncharacterized SAM-binding protein YcdF (DUF218 family)
MLSLAAMALIEDDGPRKSDAIVVLGGDATGERILKGAELEKAGYAPIVLVDGPWSLLGPESDATIKYAEQQGFPASYFKSVPLPGDADSTRSEADYLGKVIKASGFHKILLVTSNFHTRRAARLFRKENPWMEVAVVAAPYRDFSPGNWWQARPGKKVFLLEWMKTISADLGS